MKKTILILTVLLMAWSAMAQDQSINKTTAKKPQKFYIGIGLGGGFSTSSSFDMLYKFKGSPVNNTISVVPVGLGNGFNGSLSFGYWFNKYVGIELAVSGFLGLPIKGDSVINLVGSSVATVKIKGSLLSVIPAVVISAGLEKVNPYARFGFQIGALPTMVSNYSQNNGSTNPPTSKEITTVYYGGVALGYTAAGGVNFNFNKLITFNVELQFVHSTWSPNYSEIEKYSVNGQDRLSTLPTWEKQTTFVWEKNDDGVIDMTKPRQELRESVPFSTVSINVGIKFRL